MGIPQGNIISVTLFNITIHSLANVLKDNAEGSLYVCHFMICYKSKSIILNERQVQFYLTQKEIK